MTKLFLITGSTDGIGNKTAQTLLSQGDDVILHGRNPQKLKDVQQQLAAAYPNANTYAYAADLSDLAQVAELAKAIKQNHATLDVLVNNAGVFKVNDTKAPGNLDIRFVVNTIAPYLLTQLLRPIMTKNSRVINLSSAAQASLFPREIGELSPLSDSAVYAKSKLAILMWSKHIAKVWGNEGPVVIAVNPASFLGSKMVKEAYGVAGGDLQRGADAIILTAVSNNFANATGAYFDNDVGRISQPHPDALDDSNNKAIADAVNQIVGSYLD